MKSESGSVMLSALKQTEKSVAINRKTCRFSAFLLNRQVFTIVEMAGFEPASRTLLNKDPTLIAGGCCFVNRYCAGKVRFTIPVDYPPVFSGKN
jgi:hypothetical protein